MYMVYKNMLFTIPPEPQQLKKQFQMQKKTFSSSIDALSVWFGNKLPSYLWKDAGWSKTLKEEGYNWQGFLKILSLHKKEMIWWCTNTISWKDFLLQLQETITDPVIKKLVLR